MINSLAPVEPSPIKQTAEILLEAYSDINHYEELLRLHLLDVQGSRLAAQLGISPQYLCDIQKGRRKMSKNFLRRVIETKY